MKVYRRKGTMRKISVISLMIALAVPAFALEDVQTMYGKEPVDPEIIAQYEKQFKQPEVQKNQTVDEVQKVQEVKRVETVKETTASKEPTREYQEYKKEQPSNPKARFPHGLQLGGGISPTSGLNGFIGYNNKNFDSFWAKRFGFRFDFASYSPIKKDLNKEINKKVDEEGGIEFDDSLRIENFKLDAKHYGALVDFYPFGDTWFLGGLRVSGGYIFGKLDFDADIHGTSKDGKIEFELNNHKYYYSNEMLAKAMVDWKYNGPYLGAGFDLGLFWGFKIYFDAGVVYTGSPAKFDMLVPTEELTNADGVAIADDAAAQEQFNIDKNKELADARKEVKDYPYYPLIKLGLMYRF